MCATLPKVEARFETTLTAKLAADGTSFSLVTHVDNNGTELTGEYGFLIDGDNSYAEFLTGTVSAGVVTIVKRGLDFGDGSTERAALKKVHVRGASVKITDHPILTLMRGFFLGTATLPEIISYESDETFTDDKHLVAKKYVDDLDAANVKKTGAQTVAGVKTFSDSPIVPDPTTDQQVASKKYCDDTFVPDTGNTTIAGVKTFSSSPIVPTPTTDMQAATKKYMDDAIVSGGVPATEAVPGITKLNVAATDPTDPIALGANDVAETGASKVLRLKSDGKIDTTVIPDASTTVAGKVKLNVAPASATNPIALGSNDVAETGASKVVRLKSNGKLNTTVLPVVTKGNIPVADGTNYDTALAVGTDGKVLTADAASPLGVKWASVLAPVIKLYTASFGLSTTRYDITNPTGTTFRYTYDGTGANPGITSTTVPNGTVLVIAGQNFNAGNNGTFTVTGSGNNYFEVTNASGVAENDKTLGTGTIKVNYTKPANLLYAVIECVGAGGMGGDGSDVNGGRTLFGSVITCNGGTAGGGTEGGAGGTATGGDINIEGMRGQSVNMDSNGGTVNCYPARGGASALGSIGKGGDWTPTGNNAGAGGGGGGYAKKIIANADLGATEAMLIGCGGGPNITYSEAGANGAIIITEYLSA